MPRFPGKASRTSSEASLSTPSQRLRSIESHNSVCNTSACSDEYHRYDGIKPALRVNISFKSRPASDQVTATYEIVPDRRREPTPSCTFTLTNCTEMALASRSIQFLTQICASIWTAQVLPIGYSIIQKGLFGRTNEPINRLYHAKTFENGRPLTSKARDA